MQKVYNNWSKTKKLYFGWLKKNQLRSIFSKKIIYENYSLWWSTNLIQKGLTQDSKWYSDLNSIINQKKTLRIKNKNNLIYLLLKLILRIFSSIFFNIIIKIFLRDKKNKEKKINFNKNCFFSAQYNFINHKQKVIDRQYGLATFKKNKNNKYLLLLENNFNLIFKMSKIKKKLDKFSLDYFILNRHISILDILFVNYKVFIKMLHLIIILSKKNYFIINNKDCSSVLKPLLLESFFGQIQNEIINGIALRNFFLKNKFKNFINYFGFLPGSRACYYFLKSKKDLPKIVTINHALFVDNYLNNSIRKDEFSENSDDPFFSPKPNIYLTQGMKLNKLLKKTFKQIKTFAIGSLKLTLSDFKFKKKLIKKKIFYLKGTKKKIILICTGINDYDAFFKIMNNCNLKNFLCILSCHPMEKEKGLEIFNKNFKHKFIILKDFNSRELLKISDLVVVSSSAMGHEALIAKKNVIRLFDSRYPPLFDFDDGLITISNHKLLQKMLTNIKFNKYKFKKFIKNSYYMYDNKGHIRLLKFLEKIS